MRKYRLERIEKEICRVVGRLMYNEVKNPKITGLISVTKAKVTPDLKYADIFVSIINSNNQEETLEGLNEIKGFIRKKISEEMQLRHTPEIRIKLDDSIEYGVKINKIIDSLKEN